MRMTLFLVFLSGFSIFAQDFAPPPTVRLPDTTPKIQFAPLMSHCGCGRETHYTGGHDALNSFINNNISFPRSMNWGDLQTVRAYVEFVVERDGSLSDIRVIRTNFPDIDEYLLSVFEKMSNWVVGENRCTEKPSYVRVPVSVVLI